MSTTPDYAGLIERLESIPTKWVDGRLGKEAATAIRTLLESNAVLEREAQKQKERLFKQIDFTGELQRLLWALAEGNPLPDTIKGSHAYTVASRAKARFGGTPE